MSIKEEKLLRCWNCKNIINILETKICKHPAQTQICPYCKKCLCQNPKFQQLERIDDGDGMWHVGRYLKAQEIIGSNQPIQFIVKENQSDLK